MLHVEPFGDTFVVNGLQFTSAVDRDAEARTQARFVPEDAAEVWCYGVGLGDLPTLLLSRPALEHLHVVLLHRDVLQLAPHEWRRDSRVTLHPPGTVDDLARPWCVCPVELRLAEPAAHRLRDRLVATLNEPFNVFVAATFAAHWQRNADSNAPLVATDGRVLNDTTTDPRDAIVIAGGPTVAQFYDWIRPRQGSHRVIAASTALKPLLAAAIVPDVVAVLDRMPQIARHFPDDLSRLAGATLLLHLEADPHIAPRWPGRRLWMDSGDLFPGGSVVHIECDFAARQGARTVHLFGADCCYPGARTHMDGAAAAADVRPAGKFATLDGYGREAWTDEALAQYARCLEDLFALRPAVRWIKHGRAGVPLRGAEWADDDGDAGIGVARDDAAAPWAERLRGDGVAGTATAA